MQFHLKRFSVTLVLFLICFNGFSQNNNRNSRGESQKPNIIFILTDDQRWDALGYSGNSIIQTPEMDRLAKNGCYFEKAFVTTPICSASRASIFSGLHERTHKYTFQTGGIRNEYMENAYPYLLRDAGYYTGFFGKFGVNYAETENLFDVIESYDRNNRYEDHRGYYYKTIGEDTVHLTRYTGQKALDFIDNAPSDKPFGLSLSFSAPHAHDRAPLQYFWQEEPDKLYQNMKMPGPALGEDKYFEQLPAPVRDGFNRLRWTWRYDTPDKYQHSVKGYYRMIKGIDLEIAKIREKLEEKGLDKNTVIILMGDNGYFLGERQLAGKWLMYDNSVRVPLIVYDPRVEAQEDIDEMALNIDVPATIADLAGIEKPDTWQGKSLLPIVEGKTKSLDRDTILIEHLWEFEHIPPSEGVRTDDWKYFRYINDKSSEELYHLKSDPREIDNLAADPKYKQVLHEFRKKNDALGRRFADPYSGIPLDLTVEYIRDPSGTKITDSKPEFSWVVPEQAELQKAYQVLVSSSRNLAEQNIGDVWNSGRVSSSASADIEFDGAALSKHTTYFWKVRIFDKDNRLSEYSEIQQFTTGSFEGSLTSENIFQIERISPVEFLEYQKGNYFADFGKAAFGTVELQYRPKRKGEIVIRLGEKLQDGQIDRNPGGNIRFQEVSLKVSPREKVYQVELVPDERNTGPKAVALPDSFPVVMPFRYVEIEGAAGLSAEDIKQVAFFNYFDETSSSFTSSNDILNQVWQLCKYSIKATTFAGLYIDGDRERIPYEADAYLNQLSHYLVDNEYAVARRTIEYFMEHPTWPTEWQLHVALMFYADYMFTGNTELIEKYYDQLKHKTLVALENEDGLITTSSENHNGEFMQDLGFADTTQRLRDIVDWPKKGGFGGVMGETDNFVFKPVNTVVNSFYYQNMVIMEKFAEILGKDDEALDYQYRAIKTKKAINEKLFNREAGNYRDGMGTDHSSLHANMLPLAFGIVPESNVPGVVDYMKTRGMACSVYGAQYLMEALYNAGAADYAMKLLTSTEERSWYNMIRVGSTITLEAWDMKYKPNADWNHAWGAVPANIIPMGTWGITPGEPGYASVNIRPQLADLTHSAVTVPTIRGQIKAEYKKVNHRLETFTIELPANMSGEFTMEFHPQALITLNGKTVNKSFGSIRLDPGVNDIIVKINSF